MDITDIAHELTGTKDRAVSLELLESASLTSEETNELILYLVYRVQKEEERKVFADVSHSRLMNEVLALL